MPPPPSAARRKNTEKIKTGPTVPMERLPGVHTSSDPANGHVRRLLLHGERAGERERPELICVYLRSKFFCIYF